MATYWARGSARPGIPAIWGDQWQRELAGRGGDGRRISQEDEEVAGIGETGKDASSKHRVRPMARRLAGCLQLQVALLTGRAQVCCAGWRTSCCSLPSSPQLTGPGSEFATTGE